MVCMTSTTLSTHDLGPLRSSVAGSVLAPGDDGWDAARQAWNVLAEQRPAGIVFAESASDVAACVTFARRHGLSVAPQGTGHAATALEPLEDTLLLKTMRMGTVEIDATARTARVEAGALWGDVAVAAGAHGLTGLAGSSPDVGVVGYSLGGGIGWLARAHGLAANSASRRSSWSRRTASSCVPMPTTSRTCSGPCVAAVEASVS